VSSVESQKRQAERSRRSQAALEDAYKRVCASPEGKLVFWDILDRVAGVFGGVHVPGDPYSTAFGDGRRATGIDVMVLLQRAAPVSYADMVSERIREANSEAALRAAEAVPKAGEASPR
jgi:hypothetical protein